jgi:ABC-type Fe3+ transport system substrate-binding protein
VTAAGYLVKEFAIKYVKRNRIFRGNCLSLPVQAINYGIMQQFQTRQIVARIVLLIISCLILNRVGLHSVRAAQFADDWKKDWEKTVEAAKKEGQVSVYMGGWGALLESGEFQKAYPQIKVIAITGRGGEIAKRILAERRAGKYLADVSSEGVGSNFRILHAAKSFDSIKAALILPEVLDESKWWQGKHRYVDPEGQYVFRYVGVPQFGNISFNTKLVDPAEFKSYWDLLHPKWKGKIAFRDIRDPGPGNAPMRFFYHHPDIGPTFIKRLVGEMDVTLFRDFRQGVDWLASGKFSLCFFCADIDVAGSQGVPVSELGVLKEGGGLHTLYGTLSLLNKAPNPNAAKVFINWFLSRAGQVALQRSLAKVKIEAPDSLRIDIPKDNLSPTNRRADGVSYLDLDSRPEWIDMKPIVNVFETALEKRS